LLSPLKGKITIDHLKDILRDHDSGDPNMIGPNDFSICTHGHDSSTLASIIIKPATKEMWVTNTNPCLMEYERFQLK